MQEGAGPPAHSTHGAPSLGGAPAAARDGSCVLKTPRGFSTPCAAEEILNSLKMGNILRRKSRFLPIFKNTLI